MTASATVIAIVGLYLLVLLAIGVWGGRESGDVKGYFVAGKKLPSWVIAFSSNATGESAWLLLGLTGMGYLVGFHAFWVVFGEVLGVTLAWVLVARPFKVYTDRYDSVTVPDFLEDRFRDRAHVLRLLSAFIILSMTAMYTAAQLTASGKVFNAFLGTSYAAGVLIGTAIILFYTTIGGFKAVAYSDLLQGVLMFGCLLILPVVGIFAAGGWTSMLDSVRAQDATLLQPMGSLGMSAAGIASVLGFIAIGIAFLGSPQLLTRFISARDTRQITNASLIAVVCIIVFDVGAVMAGIAGRALFPGLADPETIYPLMAGQLFPAVFTGLFLVVVLAAMMSTTDSLLILASSALVRDVLQKVLRPDLSQQTLSRIGKATTVVLGIGAVFMALAEVRVIFWFVLFAWSGLACAFTPVVLCALFWKRTTRAGAIAGMAAGFIVTVAWVLLFKSRFYDLYEMIPGFLAGLAFTVVVSLFTDPPEGAADENEEVRRQAGHPFRNSDAKVNEGDAVKSNAVMRSLFMLALTGAALLADTAVAAAQAVDTTSSARAAPGPRARDLGILFDGTPGPLNAITDVAGVAVGHTTLISGSGPLVVGQGPVRTGVTAVLPRGETSAEPVFAAYHSLNGNGEMTGAAWVDESGTLEGPILITNTHSVGVVRDAAIRWFVENRPGFLWALPVVAETWDGVMNDINGFHVRPEHVFSALQGASGGAVVEGAVGGGTGMSCNGFKGGIGTSSRRLSAQQGGHTVGVLVQCNYGTQAGLLLAGIPVGRELAAQGVIGRCRAGAEPTREFLRALPACAAPGEPDEAEHGSIIIIVATDAPLLPHQLERLVMRATLGLGRTGSIASNSSGDLFIAFSTANAGLDAGSADIPVRMLPNARIDPLFRATVEATEEAIVNAMVAAETMTGADDIRMHRLPHDAVRAILRAHGRLRDQ